LILGSLFVFFLLLLLLWLLFLGLLFAEDLLSKLIERLHLLLDLVHRVGRLLSQTHLFLLLFLLLKPVSHFFNLFNKVLLLLLGDPRHGIAYHVCLGAGFF